MPHDGVSEESLASGLRWLMGCPQAPTYIYTATKQHAQDISANSLLSQPLRKIFEELHRHNVFRVSGRDICLTFGNGSSKRSGLIPRYDFTGHILACIAKPSDFLWLMGNCPNASFCLLPFSAIEGADWIRTHNPTFI